MSSSLIYSTIESSATPLRVAYFFAFLPTFRAQNRTLRNILRAGLLAYTHPKPAQILSFSGAQNRSVLLQKWGKVSQTDRELSLLCENNGNFVAQMTCFIPILSSKPKCVFCSGWRKNGVKGSFWRKKGNRSTLRVPYAKKYERFKLIENFYSSNWPARNARKRGYDKKVGFGEGTGQSLEYRMKTTRYWNWFMELTRSADARGEVSSRRNGEKPAVLQREGHKERAE